MATSRTAVSLESHLGHDLGVYHQEGDSPTYQRGHRHQDNDFGRKAGHPRTCSFCRVGQPIASALLTNPSHGHPFKAASHPEFPEPPRP